MASGNYQIEKLLIDSIFQLPTGFLGKDISPLHFFSSLLILPSHNLSYLWFYIYFAQISNVGMLFVSIVKPSMINLRLILMLKIWKRYLRYCDSASFIALFMILNFLLIYLLFISFKSDEG